MNDLIDALFIYTVTFSHGVLYKNIGPIALGVLAIYTLGIYFRNPFLDISSRPSHVGLALRR